MCIASRTSAPEARALTAISRTSWRGRLAAIAALGVAPLVGMLHAPDIADAAVGSQPSWAPHIDRSIVVTRGTSHGAQVATWYGPGLYGNRTACGGRLRPETWGIAHRTLPCGTLVTLGHRGRRLTVPVIDRGPFGGATVDLTERTKRFLRFVSGSVRMTEVTRYRVLPARRSAGSRSATSDISLSR